MNVSASHTIARALTIGVAILCGAIAASPPPAQPASMALLARATNPNPTLNSYTATAQLSGLLHAVIPIHKTLNGTVYYLRPTRKIDFQNVPGALSRFKDLASSTPSYEEAMQQYSITPLTDNGTVSTYTLVPKKSGSRVKSITVTINDQSALLNKAAWSYTNGGTLSFVQSYENVGAYRLPSKASIAARFPGYSVDGTLTFTNYQPNATVSPSVFASP